MMKVCKCSAVLFYDCSEEVMLQRLMKRARDSNRDDDNMESIKLRFKTYREDTLPVIEYYTKLGLVHKISCEGQVSEVYDRTVRELSPILSHPEVVAATASP